VHAEGVEHLRGGSEADRLAPLPHCHRRQEDRHDPVPAERQTIIRMTGDLQNELSVAALVQELICRQSADRQTTENERPRGKTEVLIALIAFEADEFNSFDFAPLLFGDSDGPLDFLNDAIKGLELTGDRTE
jgi:hypothetical protein